MSDASRAVFLSYASQDAEAARRICEALRAAGVEVWFDQSELVGGDAWDAKIRGQIAACALFVPIISAATQARLEGYFRLEWKLAAQRTHTMADEKTFLLPVVIDATRDAEAKVPAEFKAVQWTRLRADGISGQLLHEPGLMGFCARVGTLLANSEVEPGRAAPAARPHLGHDRGVTSPHQRSSVMRRWAGLGAVVALGIAGWFVVRPLPTAPAPGSPRPAVARPLSEAQQLIVKIAAIVEREADASRDDWILAESLGAQAVKLEPGSPEAWSAYAEAAIGLYEFYIDRGRSPLADALKRAQQAVTLAPESDEAKFVLANCYRFRSETRDEAETMLRALLVRRPADRRVMRALAAALRTKGSVRDVESAEATSQLEEAVRLYERAGAQPGDDPAARRELASVLVDLGRYAKAEVALDRSLALRRGPAALVRKVRFLLLIRHDVPQACSLVDTLPGTYFLREDVAEWAAKAWLWRGDPARSLKIVNAWSDEFLANNPKGFMAGQANSLLQRPDAARQAWREALAVVEAQLAAASSGRQDSYRLWKVLLLALLGEKAVAEETLRLLEQSGATGWWRTKLAHALVALGRYEAAIEELEQVTGLMSRTRDDGHNAPLERLASLRFDPTWDPLRGNPRFEALVGRIKSPIETGRGLTSATLAADQNSVAVLAFTNLSDDKDNEYFSDGISDELIDALGRVAGLTVKGRTSAFFFKGRNVPMAEIAQQLGVTFVVRGSVRKVGNSVRISAQLCRAASDDVMWSETLVRELKDVFAVQEEIAGLIARKLSLRLVGSNRAAKTLDPEAFRFFLAGRAQVVSAGLTHLNEAVRLFEQAVARAPDYADAWAQLARAHIQLARWGGVASTVGWDRARAAVAKAAALEPEAPDVLIALGWVRRTADWDWRGAERAFRRAVELRPGHSETLADAAVLLLNIGQIDDALRLARRAVELDPLNAACQANLSTLFRSMGALAESEKAGRMALQLAPNGQRYHAYLARTLMNLGRLDEAEREVALEPEEFSRNYILAHIEISRGQRDAAIKRVRALQAYGETQPNQADAFAYPAYIYARLGEFDQAFAMLERMRLARDSSIPWLRNSLDLKPLQLDPRWPALLQKIGLADDQLK